MSSVYSDKFEGVAFRSGAERARFEADARALWAVRVLDRWAAVVPREREVTLRLTMTGWRCSCDEGNSRDGYDTRGCGRGETPDAARIAAAEALVAEDPSLGEGL